MNSIHSRVFIDRRERAFLELRRRAKERIAKNRVACQRCREDIVHGEECIDEAFRRGRVFATTATTATTASAAAAR
jgi:hypothetical protein